MGSFNALLAGLATKAGANFKELADDKRKRQEKQDDVVSAAIQKELETNDTLDQSDHEALSREYYKRMGVPNQAADTLIQAHSHIFDRYNQHQKAKQDAQDAATAANPPLQGPDQSSAPTPPSGGAGPDLGPMPGQQLPQTAALPNIPPPPYQPSNPTIGEAKAAARQPLVDEQAARVTAAESAKDNAKNDAEYSKQKKLADDEFARYKDILNATKTNGGHMKNEFVNGHPRLVPDAGVSMGTVYGGDVGDKPLPEEQKKMMLLRRKYEDGTFDYEPVSQAKVSVVVGKVDGEDSPLGAWRVIQDAAGNQISKSPIQAPASSNTGTTSVTTSTPTGSVTKRTKDFGNTQNGAKLPPMPGQPVPKNGTPVGPSVQPFNPADPVDAAVQRLANDAANWKGISDRPGDVVNSNKVNKRLAELGVAPNNITGSIRDMAERAKTVLPEYDKVLGLVSKLDKEGKLGAVNSRWADFMAGKVGQGDPEFQHLRVGLSLLKSNLALVHGGARAGGSIEMAKRFDKLLNSGVMDGKTLAAGIDEAKQWVSGYSQMNVRPIGGGAEATPSTPLPEAPEIPKVNPFRKSK